MGAPSWVLLLFPFPPLQLAGTPGERGHMAVLEVAVPAEGCSGVRVGGGEELSLQGLPGVLSSFGVGVMAVTRIGRRSSRTRSSATLCEEASRSRSVRVWTPTLPQSIFRWFGEQSSRLQVSNNVWAGVMAATRDWHRNSRTRRSAVSVCEEGGHSRRGGTPALPQVSVCPPVTSRSDSSLREQSDRSSSHLVVVFALALCLSFFPPQPFPLHSVGVHPVVAARVRAAEWTLSNKMKNRLAHAYNGNSTSLEQAKRKLGDGNPPFPFDDLPTDRNDNLWSQIQEKYKLTLPELSALKNERCPAPSSGHNDALVEKVDKVYGQLSHLSALPAEMARLALHLEAKELSTPLTPAEVGRNTLARLERTKNVIDFRPPKEPPPNAVLGPLASESDARKLKDSQTEKRVVAISTRCLSRVFEDSDMGVLVNSEDFVWLGPPEHPESRKKADLFLCNPAVYAPRDPPKSDDGTSERSDSYKFGVLADWDLRDSVGALFEAKKDEKPDNAALGELVNYATKLVEGLGQREKSELVLRGAVFGRLEIWFAEFEEGVCSRIVKLKWTDEGSLQYARDFFAPAMKSPWMKTLGDIRKEAGVSFAHDKGQKGRGAFLGRGGFGRVFAVNHGSFSSPSASQSTLKALKIVRGENSGRDLVAERERLVCAARKCEGTVVAVASKVLYCTDGAELLLDEVGQSVLAENRQHLTPSCLDALCTLHKAGVVHGDPRLHNIVKVEGGLKWIDPRESQEGVDDPAKLFEHDMKVLCSSLLGLTALRLDALPHTVSESIKKYIDANAKDAADVIAKVAEYLRQRS
uniref:Protein kinase domain-containing protein n=1 Tax=Chromera velia CCMP2878 TaxID=1169474 RepID=A0A0K6S6F5_9ALVE|eukprot:Cvel_15354.t1-p1 / transcript=Cvel_15354.t1 / gene=Cvel_15354 / organism=Chromera_velia_CCMP2878 / gene_product=hypothetical protein / transcript_product=hypothetical protein / location=Cvel_scaffold1130:43874-47783(+) / protein_length=805 / sequence_SO=supercontig / SO=protein_coding / is_pseudo=false